MLEKEETYISYCDSVPFVPLLTVLFAVAVCKNCGKPLKNRNIRRNHEETSVYCDHCANYDISYRTQDTYVITIEC